MIYPKKYFKYLVKFQPDFEFKLKVFPRTFIVLEKPKVERSPFCRNYQAVVHVKVKNEENITTLVRLIPNEKGTHPYKLDYTSF